MPDCVGVLVRACVREGLPSVIGMGMVGRIPRGDALDTVDVSHTQSHQRITYMYVLAYVCTYLRVYACMYLYECMYSLAFLRDECVYV